MIEAREIARHVATLAANGNGLSDGGAGRHRLLSPCTLPACHRKRTGQNRDKEVLHALQEGCPVRTVAAGSFIDTVALAGASAAR